MELKPNNHFICYAFSMKGGSEMGKITERNVQIVSMIENEIANVGLTGKLAVEPVANTFTRRPRYFSYADGMPRFKVHMWDVNKLSDEELKEEIKNRVEQAKAHFKL